MITLASAPFRESHWPTAPTHATFPHLRETRPDLAHREHGARNGVVLGATTTDVLQTQLPAVLPEVASGSVKSVCLFVGINDFGAVVLNFVKQPGSTPADLSTQVNQALATAQNHLDQIVMTLFQVNPQVKLAVATIPLVPSLPLMVQALNRPGGQALGTDLNAAVLAYNDHIRSISYLYPSVALVDVASTFQANLKPPGSIRLRGLKRPKPDRRLPARRPAPEHDPSGMDRE